MADIFAVEAALRGRGLTTPVVVLDAKSLLELDANLEACNMNESVFVLFWSVTSLHAANVLQHEPKSACPCSPEQQGQVYCEEKGMQFVSWHPRVFLVYDPGTRV